jgi:hypothetical protein
VEFGRDDRIDIGAQLRITQHVDDVAIPLQHGFQIVGHRSTPIFPAAATAAALSLCLAHLSRAAKA